MRRFASSTNLLLTRRRTRTTTQTKRIWTHSCAGCRMGLPVAFGPDKWSVPSQFGLTRFGHRHQRCTSERQAGTSVPARSHKEGVEVLMDSPERVEVQRGLDQLRPYLAAFVEQALGSSQPTQTPGKTRTSLGRSDVYALLKIIKEEWAPFFRSRLPTVARSYVFELLDIRNRWAHQEAFSREDA